MKTAAIILAAGRENQMQSARAKELHDLLGRTLMQCTLDNVRGAAQDVVAVLGHHAAELGPAMPPDVRTTVQDFSLGAGTAKAAMAGVTLVSGADRVIITAGDMPVVSAESYRRLASAVDGVRCRAAVLYADVKHPTGYDRIIFDGDGNVKRIAPEESLMPHEEDMPSINISVYCFSYDALVDGLARLQPEESGLWRLSGLAALLAQEGETVAAVPTADPREALRVVTRRDLANAIAYMKELNCVKHMMAGVTIIDPASTYIESDVVIGADTIIYPGCFLQGGTQIGRRCTLLPHCRLKDAILCDDVTVESSILIGCRVPSGESIPPFTVRHE